MLNIKWYISFILVVGVTVLLYLYADKELTIYFHQMSGNELKDFFHFLTRFGKSEWYLIPSISLYAWFRYTRHFLYAKQALYVFVTNVVAGLGVWLFKVPFGRARPELYFKEDIYGFQWFEITPKYASFPSGHTITVISTAVALSLLFPRWKYPILLFGTLVALSRVVITAHYLSDVVFASFLGTAVAVYFYQYYFKESK
ncbi:MAG TPA: phosphatase PAP2 family protein [Epsilonproteobacteria bacterium]|nr:phosphatase PAP2 family protein [Campylobacterota bacterium]